AVRWGEQVAVHPVRDEGLGMHRALHVPALVIPLVETAEVDELRVVGGPGSASEIADAHARPGGSRVPPLDAELVDLLRAARQLHEIVERQRERPPYRARDFQTPDAGERRIPYGHARR